ncbi:uncharacterized protein [Euwallacea similis]|uniref:uncharacterized protein n=1 Tax=Euwallacea similis TaxID=1736056 RepID=UPI00344BAE33
MKAAIFSNMKNQTVIVILCFSFYLFHVAQLTPVKVESVYQKLSEDELLKIALTCIDEIQINRTIIEHAMKSAILPIDDRKYQQYLVCSYKKQGYLSEDGKTILYHNIEAFLEDYYSKSELQQLEKCKSIMRKDSGELCVHSLSCILSVLTKIERETKDGKLTRFESNSVE